MSGRVGNVVRLQGLVPLALVAAAGTMREITQMAGGLRRLTLSGNKLKKDVMKLEKLGDLGGIAE